MNPKGRKSECTEQQEYVDLKELVDELGHRGLRAPLLIRFSDIVNSRINKIYRSFQNSFKEFSYKGKYRGVYPIKVNHQRHLVEEIIRFGRDSSLGIEAGSKPELLVAMALLDSPNALLICNGFKDNEYIETALYSRKLGRNTIIVIDRFAEIDLIVKASKKLKIKPRIGFRMKLDTNGVGKWAESSGSTSKFGLSAGEMIRAIEILKAQELIDCVEMLHFHMGSQITAIRCIKDSLVEATRVFVELSKLGAPLTIIDVGGGLGVDYDGSQSNWENSVNYCAQEYANEVVSHIAYVCDEHKINHPDIVTESGRALVAHHSVLVFNVVGVNNGLPRLPEVIPENTHENVAEILETYDKLCAKNLNESIQDVMQLRDEGLNLFNLGYMDLTQKAIQEEAFKAFCHKALDVSKTVKRKPEELEYLKKFIRNQYYGNLSIFQSAPDMWAVEQIFPVMPIHRLNEKPSVRGTFLDLTCDSDGKINRFVDEKDVKSALELHPFKSGEDYYVGIFLIGAYQETLGDFHNLFGDTDAVHVSCTKAGYIIEDIVEGDTVSEVLDYVEYDRPSLVKKVRIAIEDSLSKKRITLKESKKFIRKFEDSLSGYTYLEDEEQDYSENVSVHSDATL